MNNIKYVEIGGKKYPVSLNMLALSDFLESNGQTMQTFDSYIAQNLGNLLRLFHYMLVYGGQRTEKPFTISVDDLADMIGMNFEIVNNTLAAFMPDDEKKPMAQTRPKKKKR